MPFKVDLKGRCYRAPSGAAARFSCDTPPNPGKRSAAECSATLWRDRIAVAVGSLRSEEA